MKKTGILVLILALLAACIPDSPDILAPVENALMENIGQTSFGGKVFCSYDVLGSEARSDGMDVYVWALCGEYYLDNGVLTLGTGSSMPVAIHMQKAGRVYEVVSCEIPSDGMDYMPSIQRIFTAAAIQKMCHENPDCYNERAQRLQNASEQKAREYYGLK
jgi:hypothetical protein